MSTSHIPKPIVRQTLTPDWDRVGITKAKSIFQPYQEGEYKPFIDFHPAKLRFERPSQRFVTGSSYEGSWDSLGFSGCGSYVFTHGAIYEGEFRDGQFHGSGTITYPVGHKVIGSWKNGRLIDHTFVFKDGLEYKRPWKYCVLPDRRFQTEFNEELRGPGKEFLTNKQPTVQIPDGCYDTVDGFYDPSDKCVYSYDEDALAGALMWNCLSENQFRLAGISESESINATPLFEISTTEHKKDTDSLKRIGGVDEIDFIRDHFRAATLNHVGYRPDLYEDWNTGATKDVKRATCDLGFDELESGSCNNSKDSSTLKIETN